MGSIFQPSVISLSRGLPVFDESMVRLTEEWSPDQVPLTIAMGDLGRTFARAALGLQVPEVETVFSRVEAMLNGGTEQEKDGIATGFLEAMVAVLDRMPRHRWILEHAGPMAREYLESWDQFCGRVDALP